MKKNPSGLEDLKKVIDVISSIEHDKKRFIASAKFWRNKKGYKEGWIYIIWKKKFPREPVITQKIINSIRAHHPMEDRGAIEDFKTWLFKQK